MGTRNVETSYEVLREWAMEGVHIARLAIRRYPSSPGLVAKAVAPQIARLDVPALATLATVLMIECAKLLEGGRDGKSSGGAGLEGQSTGAGGP